MRLRHADDLQSIGFEGLVEEFRRDLVEVNAGHFPGFTDKEMPPAVQGLHLAGAGVFL